MKTNLPFFVFSATIVLAACSQPVKDGYGIGDPYPDAENAIGVVYAVSEDGKHGMVVSKDQITAAWSPYTDITNATDSSDGVTNRNTIERLDDWTNRYPAFKGCKDMGPGWYLPSKNELKALYAGQLNLKWVASGANAANGEVNDWADNEWFPGDFNQSIEVGKDFDQQLESIGGASLSNLTWSSTEKGETFGWTVDFLTGKTEARRKVLDIGVRCVRAF